MKQFFLIVFGLVIGSIGLAAQVQFPDVSAKSLRGWEKNRYDINDSVVSSSSSSLGMAMRPPHEENRPFTQNLLQAHREWCSPRNWSSLLIEK